jgi:peptide/nickel transport system substrate-binding protein
MENRNCTKLVVVAGACLVAALIGSASNAQKFGGTMVFGTTIEPQSFNPYVSEENATSLRLCELIYESLVTPRTIVDPKSEVEVVPLLAEEFFPSIPGTHDTEFTFVLRKNVYWHSAIGGERHPFTAHDVKFTIDYIKNSPDVPSVVRERFRCIAGAKVLSDHSVTIGLDGPRYNALYLFTFKILPRHCFTGEFRPASAELNINRRPVGTGPFVFDTWDPFTNLIHFHASEDYWNGHGHPSGNKRAYMDSIRVKIVSDEDFLHQALLNKEIDIMAQVKPGYVDLIQSDPDLTLQKYLNNRTAFIAYNCATDFFGNREVRCALGLAIDRQWIVDDVFAGHATIVDGPLPPWFLPDLPTDPRPPNPDECRRILEGEGWIDTSGNGTRDRNGSEFEFDIIYPELKASGTITTVCEHISMALEEVGVEADLRNIDYKSFLRTLYDYNDYEAAYVDVSLESVSSVSALFSCAQRTEVTPRGRNFMNFCDGSVDSLIGLYESTLNSEHRLQIASRLQEAIAVSCPSTFLWCVDNFAGQRLRLQGVQVDPLVFFRRVHDWYLVGR